MSVGIILMILATLGAGAGAAAYNFRDDNKQNHGRKTEELMLQKDSEGTKKDDLSVLEYLTENDYFNEFKVIQRNKRDGTGEYRLLINGLLIEVIIDKSSDLHCKVTKGGELLLDYSHDDVWDEPRKMEISNHFINLRNPTDAAEIINDFIDAIRYFDWDDEFGHINVVGDLGNVELKDSLSGSRQVYIEQSNEDLSDMDVFEKEVLSAGFKETIESAFVQSINKIKVVSDKLVSLKEEIDLETRHIYENSITKDVQKIYDAYAKLEEGTRDGYEEGLLLALKKIDRKVEELMEQTEKRNIHEIDSILRVIDERYQV